VLVLAFVVSLEATFGQAGVKQNGAPTVIVGAALKEKAKLADPSASAKKKTRKFAIGNDKLAMEASQESAFWNEEIDLDDDGAADKSDFLYDKERGVLYTFRQGNFVCPNGDRETGSILEAIYVRNNRRPRPVGSGWYVVALDAGQCGAAESVAFGCRFFADGKPTECGVAKIDNATGEVDLDVIE
jgi:hypothetical protein